LQERYHGQCIRRVREECKIGNELVLGADLKVVTGLCLAVTHGILLHSHESSVIVCFGIGVPVLQRVRMVVVFLQLVPVLFQLLELFAFLFQRSLFLFRGGFRNLFKCLTQFSRHFGQHGRSEFYFLIAFRGVLLNDDIVYLS